MKKFTEAKGDSKKTWQTIKSETGSKTQQKNELNDNFKIDGKSSYDKQEIANGFNTYFNNIGKNLADNIPTPQQDYKHYANKDTKNTTFSFKTVTSKQVLKIGNSLKPKASCGPDGISSKTLKQILPAIINPTTHIINLSLSTGHVPDFLKTSTIIPIFKVGDKDIFGNH